MSARMRVREGRCRLSRGDRTPTPSISYLAILLLPQVRPVGGALQPTMQDSLLPSCLEKTKARTELIFDQQEGSTVAL